MTGEEQLRSSAASVSHAMALPTRSYAIETLEEGQRTLDALLDQLSDEATVRPATIGGGDWSAKDLIGHIAFWEETALEALAAWQAGERPEVEAVFEQGPAGTDAANARNQHRTSRQSLQEVRSRAAASHAGVLQALRDLSDGAWRARAPYRTNRRETLAALLGGVLGAPRKPFGHAFVHLPDLEAYVRSLPVP